MTALRYHAVFGGSAGLGLAYAKRMARDGGHILLVGRNARKLSAAVRLLQHEGAAFVEAISGDLLDPAFRRNVLVRSRKRRPNSVFIGGPSPRPGSLWDVHSTDLHRGLDAALIYPLDVVRSCVAGGVRRGGSVVLVSSATALRPLDVRAQFFISNMFRRVLETAVQDVLTARIRLQVWHPTVVLTPLALAYARRHQRPRETTTDTLARLCGVAAVPTADEYVAAMLSTS